MNLMEGILAERDRLQEFKNLAGDLWDAPNMAFYRVMWQLLMDKATEAIGGHMDVDEMLKVYNELKEFEA